MVFGNYPKIKLKSNKIILPIVALCVSAVLISSCNYKEQIEEQTTATVEATEEIKITEDISEPTEEIKETEISTTEETIESTSLIEETINKTTEPTESTKETVTEPTEETVMLIDLGRFTLTAYCSCEKCCGEYALNRPIDENGNEIVYGSIGVRLVAGISIAVDPNVIPYGSEVIINGHTYIAHDTGGAIKGNRIDVYFDDHQEAWNFGTQYAEVYLVQN